MQRVKLFISLDTPLLRIRRGYPRSVSVPGARSQRVARSPPLRRPGPAGVCRAKRRAPQNFPRSSGGLRANRSKDIYLFMRVLVFMSVRGHGSWHPAAREAWMLQPVFVILMSHYTFVWGRGRVTRSVKHVVTRSRSSWNSIQPVPARRSRRHRRPPRVRPRPPRTASSIRRASRSGNRTARPPMRLSPRKTERVTGFVFSPLERRES